MLDLEVEVRGALERQIDKLAPPKEATVKNRLLNFLGLGDIQIDADEELIRNFLNRSFWYTGAIPGPTLSVMELRTIALGKEDSNVSRRVRIQTNMFFEPAGNYSRSALIGGCGFSVCLPAFGEVSERLWVSDFWDGRFSEEVLNPDIERFKNLAELLSYAVRL